MNCFKQLVIFTFLFAGFQLYAQKNNSDALFIDFGDEKITKGEFKSVYLKNNNSEIVSKSSVEEYLDLYINFKLKVKEAKAKGLDTLNSFKSELAGYRKQLAQPYLSEQGILEDLKKEAYNRLKEDVRVSHILISVSQEASPEDTLKAYQSAERIKKMLQSGKDFEELAKKYSNDPCAQQNGGDLGYFTGFYMVYPFESAAYNTKVGEISKIVRSQFGYHIVKVVDKRPAIGTMTAAHILISNDPQLSKTNDPEGRIFEIHNELKNGATFEDMALQFSDDSRSASQGGVLQPFGVGRMVPEFEEAAFSLKKDGDYSEPFQTNYGWHIVKRISLDGIDSYEEMEPIILEKIKKDSRSKLTESARINKIKNQYGFKEKLKYRDQFYSLIDSTYFSKDWNSKSLEKLNKTMFSIGDKEVNQADFVTYLKNSQINRSSISIVTLINNKYTTFKNREIIAYKDKSLDNEYPEFKALMQEYNDGILLFNLTDQMVWSKAATDTTGLQEFYEKNKENYRWGKRVDAVVFSALNEKIAKDVRKMIKDSLELQKIVNEVNRPSQLNLKYELGKFEKGSNTVVDQVEWKKGISENISTNGRISFVYIKEVLEPGYRDLNDSKGLITSDYQEYLEKVWIKTLQSTYNYKVDKTILDQLKKELN